MKLRNPIDLRALKISLGDLYSTKDDESKGRLISLSSSLIATIYNVFITGIFYTGFLSMYGISITGVGIVSFIPYIASCFSLFSPFILERIKKRKFVLLASKLYFYTMYIIATMLMPLFVTDPDERLIWFIVILFLAYSVYALFSNGFTTWFYRFYPQDNVKRTKFFVYNSIFTAILSSVVMLLSGVLTDAVAGSPLQDQLILGLRYFGFFLVIVDICVQACAKEYPYPEADKIKLTHVFTLPFKYRKFLLCVIVMFFWSFISNLNNGMWNYHLLNHLNFSYTLLNTMSIVYTVILLCTNSFWQRMLRQHSWIKTFGLSVLLFMPTEFIMFTITSDLVVLFIIASVIQNLMSVGINLSYSNILYMNLPEENSTVYVTFHAIGCNLFAFLGMMTGTYISGITGDDTVPFLGMQVYSVQFTTLARAFFLTILGVICIFFWKHFTNDKDIAEVEEQKELRKYAKQANIGGPSKWQMLMYRIKTLKKH